MNLFSNIADLTNAAVQKVSILQAISSFYSAFSRLLGTVSNYNWYYLHFHVHSFFSKTNVFDYLFASFDIYSEVNKNGKIHLRVDYLFFCCCC